MADHHGYIESPFWCPLLDKQCRGRDCAVAFLFREKFEGETVTKWKCGLVPDFAGPVVATLTTPPLE